MLKSKYRQGRKKKSKEEEEKRKKKKAEGKTEGRKTSWEPQAYHRAEPGGVSRGAALPSMIQTCLLPKRGQVTQHRCNFACSLRKGANISTNVLARMP